MFDEMNEAMEALIKDEDFLRNIAKIMKKLYDELIIVGFTEEQAAKIVSNYNPK